MKKFIGPYGVIQSKNLGWYFKVYNQIIERGKLRGLKKKKLDYYTEKHHILPKSLNGTDCKSNLVLLTAREHFICHVLLSKIYGGKMIQSVFLMSNKKKYNSKQYEYLRIKYKEINKNVENKKLINRDGVQKYILIEEIENYLNESWKMGPSEEQNKKNSESHKNLIKESSTLKKLSESQIERITINRDGKELKCKKEKLIFYLEQGYVIGVTQEHKDNNSKSKSGDKHWMFNKKVPEKTKQRMREAQKDRIVIYDRNGNKRQINIEEWLKYKEEGYILSKGSSKKIEIKKFAIEQSIDFITAKEIIKKQKYSKSKKGNSYGKANGNKIGIYDKNKNKIMIFLEQWDNYKDKEYTLSKSAYKKLSKEGLICLL